MKKLVFPISLLIVILISTFLLVKRPQKQPTSTANIADDYPESPVYPNADFQDSNKVESYTKTDFSYDGTWKTQDDVATVMAWYIDKLKNDGWNMNVLPANPNATDIQYAEGYYGKNIYKIIQVSVIKEKDTQKTKIVLEFPSKSSSFEDEEE
jgi:hypothetical protein